MSRIRPVNTPDLCKIVSLAVLFDSNGNSQSVRRQTCVCVCVCVCVYIYIYTHTHSSEYRDAGRAKEIS